MSGTTNSADYNNVVNSDGGTNVMPALICDSHFFLDTVSGSDFTSAFTQASNHEFGALSTTQFRTSSKITINGAKKLRAICNGQVFLQPVTGAADKVNLILKPSEQPIPTLGVKYFIFRNLPLDQFFEDGSFEGDTVKMIKTRSSENDSAVSEFVNHLWNQFEAYNSMADPMPAFLAKYIGFISGGVLPTEGVFPDEKLLDEVFFKISSQVAEIPNPDLEDSAAADTGTDADSDTESEENTNDTIEVLEEVLDEAVSYEIPLVFKGMELCELNGDTISIDVVLDYGDYIIPNDPNPFKMNLAFARSADHILDTSFITFETDDSQERKDYLTKLYKESCTQFIDICAFYGLHAEAGNLYANGDNATVLTQDNLVSAISGFQSKHTIYLYIQANRQRSYNFYGNYEHPDGVSGNINIGTDPDNLTNTRFDESGWPIYQSDTVQFSSSDAFVYHLNLLTDNQYSRLSSLRLGSLLNANNNNFIQNIDSAQVSKNFNENNDLLEINFNSQFEILLEINASNFRSICSFKRILHDGIGLIVENRKSSQRYKMNISSKSEFFYKLNAISNIEAGESDFVQIGLINEKLDFHANNENKKIPFIRGVLKTIDTVESEDSVSLRRATLESRIKKSQSDYRLYNTPAEMKTETIRSSIVNNKDKKWSPEFPYLASISRFREGYREINGVSLKNSTDLPSSKTCLGIIESEMNLISNFIDSIGLNNCAVNLNPDKWSKYISREGITYLSSFVEIISEDTSGELSLYTVEPKVQIYTIDKSFFFSRAYTETQEDISLTPFHIANNF